MCRKTGAFLFRINFELIAIDNPGVCGYSGVLGWQCMFFCARYRNENMEVGSRDHLKQKVQKFIANWRSYASFHAHKNSPEKCGKNHFETPFDEENDYFLHWFSQSLSKDY